MAHVLEVIQTTLAPEQVPVLTHFDQVSGQIVSFASRTFMRRHILVEADAGTEPWAGKMFSPQRESAGSSSTSPTAKLPSCRPAPPTVYGTVVLRLQVT